MSGLIMPKRNYTRTDSGLLLPDDALCEAGVAEALVRWPIESSTRDEQEKVLLRMLLCWMHGFMSKRIASYLFCAVNGICDQCGSFNDSPFILNFLINDGTECIWEYLFDTPLCTVQRLRFILYSSPDSKSFVTAFSTFPTREFSFIGDNPIDCEAQNSFVPYQISSQCHINNALHP